MSKLKLRNVLAGLFATVVVAGGLTGCNAKAAVNAANTATSEAVETEVAAVEETPEVRTIYAVTGASPRPFTYYGDDNELVGQNIELVTAIFDKLPQYELVWEVTDFPSIFAGLDADKYQLGVNNFAKNAEREEKYLFTDPIFSNAYIVVAGKDVELPELVDFSDLAGYSYVGQVAINSTTAIENYNEANPDNPIEINYTE